MGFKKSDFENFQSDWLSKDDLQDGPLIVTIDRCDAEDVKDIQSGKNKRLPILHFKEDVKPFILSANVNWDTVEMAYGPDTDQWSGKPLEFYFDPNVSFGGKKTGGVRIRIQTSSFGKTPHNGTSKSAAPAPMSMDDAIRECATVGISREEMVAELKRSGFNGWNTVQCTPLVKQLIAAKSEGRYANQNAPLDDDEIPFAPGFHPCFI